MPLPGRLQRVRATGDGGAGVVEYVGALLVVVLVLAAISSTLVADDVAEEVGDKVLCAARSVGTHDRAVCVDVGGEVVPVGNPAGGYPEDCDEVVYGYLDPAVRDDPRPAVRVDCGWVPLPPECVGEFDGVGPGAAPGAWRPGEVVPEGSTGPAVELARCVGEGRGGPSEDPDDPACQAARPGDGEVGSDPPTVQVGCRELVVPRPCEERWDAFRAVDGPSRALLGDDLGTCVTDWYDTHETICVVAATTETTRVEMRIFFLKMAFNEGMLVEELGDGRVRVHALQGVKVGGELGVESKSVSRGVEFNLKGLSGWDSSDIYEFGDMASAEAWVDWYREFRPVYEKYRTPESPRNLSLGISPNGANYPRVVELLQQEPARKAFAEGTSRSAEVGVRAGWSSTGGRVDAGGGGTYTATGTRELRTMVDGSAFTSLSMRNEGGFALLGSVGLDNQKKRDRETQEKDADGFPTDYFWMSDAQRKEADDRRRGKDGVKAKDKVGLDWAGQSSVGVFWAADGTPERVVLRADSEVMSRLLDLSPGVTIGLPRAFEITAKANIVQGQGNLRSTEVIVTMDQLEPEQRERITRHLADMFPREDDGTFSMGAARLTKPDDPVGDVAESQADLGRGVVTRSTRYDTRLEEYMGGAGLVVGGVLPVFEVTGGKITDARKLTGSALDVPYAGGAGRTAEQSPTPRCRDNRFTGFVHDEGVDYERWEVRPPRA